MWVNQVDDLTDRPERWVNQVHDVRDRPEMWVNQVHDVRDSPEMWVNQVHDVRDSAAMWVNQCMTSGIDQRCGWTRWMTSWINQRGEWTRCMTSGINQRGGWPGGWWYEGTLIQYGPKLDTGMPWVERETEVFTERDWGDLDNMTASRHLFRSPRDVRLDSPRVTACFLFGHFGHQVYRLLFLRGKGAEVGVGWRRRGEERGDDFTFPFSNTFQSGIVFFSGRTSLTGLCSLNPFPHSFTVPPCFIPISPPPPSPTPPPPPPQWTMRTSRRV